MLVRTITSMPMVTTNIMMNAITASGLRAIKEQTR
jgi:hypothetical protein